MSAPATKPHPLGESKRFLRTFERLNLLLVVAAAGVAGFAMGPGAFLWGVLVGGAFTILNIRALSWLAERLIAGGPGAGDAPRSRAVYVVLFLAKFTALCGAIWAALTYLPVAPLGVLTGFSSLLPAMLLATLAATLAPTARPTSSGMSDAPAAAFGPSNPRSSR